MTTAMKALCKVFWGIKMNDILKCPKCGVPERPHTEQGFMMWFKGKWKCRDCDYVGDSTK
jgi:rubredoxin